MSKININEKDDNQHTEWRLTHFPNDNSKQIDYVIKYKTKPEQTKIQNRIEAFLKEILSQQIQIEYLYFKHNHNLLMNNNASNNNVKNEEFTYALLHCPHERLLKEAETIKLEMDLKKVTNIVLKYFAKINFNKLLLS